jgi:PAS domain S-box-containing protein
MKDLLDRFLEAVWKDRPIRQRGTVIVSIPVICLFASLIAIAGMRDKTIKVRKAIDSNKEILQQTNRLYKTVVDAETGLRGYGLTKRRDFLAPYLEAKKSLPPLLAKLQVLTKNNQLQSQQFAEIKNSTEQQIDFFQLTLNKLDNSETKMQSPEIIQVFSEDKFKMDRLREKIDAFADAGEAYQNVMEPQIREWVALTNSVQFTAVLIGFLGAAASWYLFDSLEQELKKRESSLQESKSRIQAVVDNAADGIITLDEWGKIESFNTAAERIFGWNADRIIGLNLRQLLAKPLLNKNAPDYSIEYFLLHYNVKLSICQQETVGIRQNGKNFPIEVAVSEMQLKNQRLFIAICRDCGERKQAEESLGLQTVELQLTANSLAQTTADLKKRNQELDQFAYVVSHDLKAPLRAIANLSSWIEEDLSESMTEDTLHQMNLLRGRVHRMEGLIEGLLQYSRVGRIEVALETVKVEKLLAEIIDSLAPPAEFVVEVQPGMPTFLAQKLLLQQVFSNLISNAIKHHQGSDGNIKISVQDTGDFYKFSVADDGAGIAAQYHDKVFIIFQTLEARDRVENTGIGLSLVKKIVENQGGTIYLESAEGEGATFSFTWPKQPISNKDRN